MSASSADSGSANAGSAEPADVRPVQPSGGHPVESGLPPAPEAPSAEAASGPVDGADAVHAQPATSEPETAVASDAEAPGTAISVATSNRQIQRFYHGDELPPLPAGVLPSLQHLLGTPPPAPRRPWAGILLIGAIAAMVAGTFIFEILDLMEDTNLANQPRFASSAPPLPQATTPPAAAIVKWDEADLKSRPQSLQSAASLHSAGQPDNPPAGNSADAPEMTPSAEEITAREPPAAPEAAVIAAASMPPLAKPEPPESLTRGPTLLPRPEPPEPVAPEALSLAKPEPPATPEPVPLAATEPPASMVAPASAVLATREPPMDASAPLAGPEPPLVAPPQPMPPMEPEPPPPAATAGIWKPEPAQAAPSVNQMPSQVGKTVGTAPRRAVAGASPARMEARNGITHHRRQHLTPEELTDLSGEELIELFVRKGRSFRDPVIREYLSQLPW